MSKKPQAQSEPSTEIAKEFQRSVNSGTPTEKNLERFTHEALHSTEALADTSMHAAAQTLEVIVKSNLSESSKADLRGRLKRITRKFMRVFQVGTLLASAGTFADYKLTRYEVKARMNAEGAAEYAHDDPQTTRILNALSERGELGKSGQSELYQALWMLEQECGNPKVRFLTEERKGISGTLTSGDGHYNPFTNTVFINMNEGEEMLNSLIAEFSHGKQFHKNPLRTSLEGIKNYAWTAKTVFEDWYDSGDAYSLANRLRDAHAKTYDVPGNLEYEAHEAIEPNLQARLEEMTPRRAERIKQQQLAKQRKAKVIQAEIDGIEQEEKKEIMALIMKSLEMRARAKSDAQAEEVRKKLQEDAWATRESFLHKKQAAYKRFEKNQGAP